MRKISIILTGLIIALLVPFAGTSFAGEPPVVIHAKGRIHILQNVASLTITHSATGGDVTLTLHVNLRPDNSPGPGPNWANKSYVVTADQSSPETFTIPLPKPIPGWCFVQADASWHGGKATSPKVPIPGSACDGSKPTPTPTATPKPSHKPTAHPHPTASHSTPVLAHTGYAGVVYVGVIALAVFLMVVGGLTIFFVRLSNASMSLSNLRRH